MTTIFAFIIVLGILVFIHELGHFLAARWAGARVDTFSIGFGRPLLKWHDKYGTKWQVAMLPLGGYVKIYGQDDMFNSRKYNELSKTEKQGHYLSLFKWKQAIVIGAGSFMNILLAWFVYSFLFIGTQTIQLPFIGQVQETTEHLQVGDQISMINGKAVNSWTEMIIAKELSAGAGNMGLTVLRGETAIEITMPAGTWGILPDTSKTTVQHNGMFTAMGKAANEVAMQSRLMVTVISQIITGQRSPKQLGGVISIAENSGRAMAAGVLAMLALIAMLSINLAVINLLPLPALDGGFLLMILIETITRRKMDGKKMEYILQIGWILLLSLIAFTILNDTLRMLAR